MKQRKVMNINAKKIRVGDYLAWKHCRDGWAMLDYHKTSPEYRVFEQYCGDPVVASLIQRISYLARQEKCGMHGGVAQGISPPTIAPEHSRSQKQYLTDYLGCHRNTILSKLDPWRVHYKMKKGMGRLIPANIDFGGKLFATYHHPAFKLHSLFWYLNPKKTYEINHAVVKILADSHSDYIDDFIIFDPVDDTDVRQGNAKSIPRPAKESAPATKEQPKVKPVEAAEAVASVISATTDGATFVDGGLRSLEVQYVYITQVAKSPEHEAEALLERIKKTCKNFKFSMARIGELREYDCAFLDENDEWPLQ